jgi:hypothetical protein
MAGLAIPLAISGISALSGLFSNKKSTATQQQNTTNDVNTTDTQQVDLSNLPQYSPEMQQVLEFLTSLYRDRALSNQDLSGYTGQGLRNINQGADIKRRALENILAARGLNYSPTAANALGRIESGRIGEQVNFLSGIPLLQRQLQGEDIDAFSRFFTSLPVGTRQIGTTTRTGQSHSTGTGNVQSTQPGNKLGGLFSGLGAGLAYGYGQGAFGQKQKPGNVNQFPW